MARTTHTPPNETDEIEDIDNTGDSFAEALPEHYGPQPGYYAHAERRRSPFVSALISAGVVIVLGFAIVAGLIVMRGGSASSGSGGLKVGMKPGMLAPDFVLQDVNTGKNVQLSSLRGKPVWVNFWATWCPPCQQEMPDMQGIYNEYQSKGLVLLGVDVQESDAAVKDYITKNKFNWTFLMDRGGDVTDVYQVDGLPKHVFIDPNGIIKVVHEGGLTNTAGTFKLDLHQYINQIVPSQ
jgi:peroxiredoxin